MRIAQWGVIVSLAISFNAVPLILPDALLQRVVSPVLAQTAQDQLAEASRLLKQGDQQYRTSRYREAIQSWQQVLEICRDPDVRRAYPEVSRNGEALALSNLGAAYNDLSQYQQAIDYLEQALPIFREVGNRNGEAGALNNLGIAYNALSQYQQAIDYLEQALPILQEVGDRNGEAKVLGNLGIAYNVLSQYQQAIDYFEQALPIFREMGNRNGEALALMNLGIAYGDLRQYDQAIDSYQQALPIFREVGDRANEGLLLSNIGRLYALQNSPASAIQYLQKSVEVRESIRADLLGLPQADQQAYTDSIAEDYQFLAELLRQQGRIQEAQAVLDLL